jgi:CHAP domain
MINLAAFISTLLGAPNVGDTPENTGQCVGLIERWLSSNTKPHIWGDAKDLLANADLKIYRIVHNNPTNAPPPGAVVVWDASWGAGHGHTAICVAGNANHLAVFEQNDPMGSPCLVATHDYAGVAGWLYW